MATSKSGMIATGRVAENRKARHDYEIMETLEAGIVLMGSEVKSLRAGRASIAEAYASDEGGVLMLINADIPEYAAAGQGRGGGHEPKRKRALLLHKKQCNKLIGAINRDGITVIPLSLYFNDRGIAKISLGLAKGKKKHDKREAIKKRDWERDKARILKPR